MFSWGYTTCYQAPAKKIATKGTAEGPTLCALMSAPQTGKEHALGKRGQECMLIYFYVVSLIA